MVQFALGFVSQATCCLNPDDDWWSLFESDPTGG